MAEKFPEFVGRDTELQTIEDLVHQRGTRKVLLVHGIGGIGKTRLLQEAKNRLGREKDTLFTSVLDLDDTAIRVPSNLGRAIAQDLGQEHFGEYLRRADEYMRAGRERVDPETLLAHLKGADKVFLENYNRLAAQKRIVILADAVETVQDTDMWRYFINIIEPMTNTLIIAAGRRCDEVQGELQHRLGAEAVAFLPVTGFGPEEAAKYFKQTEVGASVEQETQEKILFLTEGRPILLALVIEWLEREIPLPELMEKSLIELQALDHQAREELRDKFEAELVKSILRLVEPIHRTVLMMAQAYRRTNADVLSHVIEFTRKESEEIVAGLRYMPFVKPRPGYYVLHDEMRDLVRKHVWPYIDPMQTQRKGISQKMVAYYDLALEQLSSEWERKNTRFQEAAAKFDETQGDTAGLVRLVREMDQIERNRWVFGAERLFYALDASLADGYRRFTQDFDQATQDYRFSFRAMLCGEMQPFETKYPEGADERYEIGRRVARHLLDDVAIEQAYDRAVQLLVQYPEPECQVEMLLLKANCAARLPGKVQEAVAGFEQGLRICEKHNLIKFIGRVENELGWIHRLIGRWELAAEHYNRGRDYNEAAGEYGQAASSLNSHAYVSALQGHYDNAIELCRQGLDLRRRFTSPRFVGMSYSTLGEIYRYKRDFEHAFECYREALKIFEREEDNEWLAVIYQQQAIAKLQGRRNLQEAWEDVSRSIELCREYNVKYLPSALNRAGRIAAAREQFDQAERLFKEGVEEAEKVSDAWMGMATSVEMMELGYERWAKERTSRYIDLIEDYGRKADRYEKEGFMFRDLMGRTRRIRGHILYDRYRLGEADLDALERALTYYQDAYPLIAQGYAGSHGLHALPEELEDLGARVDRLAPALATQWCDRLKQNWAQRGVPSSLLGFCTQYKIRAEQRAREGAEHV